MTYIIPIISALAGAGVFGFIEFLIRRKDSKNDELKDIKSLCEELRLDLCRLQLLNLIQHDGSQHECMLVAQRYFKDLKGNWYMTPKFLKWLEEKGVEKPSWFNSKETE